MGRRIYEYFILLIPLVFVLFHLCLPVYGFLPSMRERAVHLGLAFIMIFIFAAQKRRPFRWAVDIVLASLGAVICIYVFIDYYNIMEQYGTADSNLQVFMGLALILLILEMARRAVRPTLPAIALLFLLYAFFGHLIPGAYGHPKYSLETVVSSLFLTNGGLWGQLLGVSSNIIAIFVFLGAFIVHTGGGYGFMKISTRLAGRYRGGPAKVAAVSSALFGSISGSASANVASTGSFTIPMMKRLGYKPELAAAVEAVASTGGQIMPPIMGAGAFVMAELVQIPYLHVAAAALIPALLYFLAVGLGIHFYSGREGYQGMDNSEIPGWGETIRASIFFLIPFTVLAIWLGWKFTPQFSAFWALLSTLPLAFLNTRWSWEFSSAWPKYRQAILDGARQAAVIASICACAQVIISVVALTGVGVKFSTGILSMTGENLFLALLLTGLTSIILGMEVPTTAAYIVAVVVGGPVLEELGVPLLSAHLFVFYLAILSAITPPICGAVFIAAGMAEANWVETAKIGLKLAFALFLLPFLFAYEPSLVLIGPIGHTFWAAGKGILAIALLSAGLMGYWRAPLRRFNRLALMAAGCFYLSPFLWLHLAGIPLVIGVLFNRTTRTAKSPTSV